MVLDNGDYWETYDFQDEIVADIFSGVPEILVVIGEANAKTTLLAGVNLYFADFKPTANCLVAAASREQAGILFDQAAGLVYRSPGFLKRFRVFEGYRRITAYRSHGKIQVKAADDRTGDGAIPDLATIDEPHRARDMRLWRTWRGKLDKRNGQLLGISTAGEPGSEFEDVRAAMHRTAAESVTVGRHTRSCTPGESLIHDWRLNREDDPNDMEVVKLANPLPAHTAESLARKRRSPSMTDEHWARFVCGIPTRMGGPGVDPELWASLEQAGVRPDLRHWTVGFLDVAYRIDTTAMGALTWESHDRRVISGTRVLRPTPTVRTIDIVKGLLALQADFPEMAGVVYDENAAAFQLAQLLADGRHPLQYDDDVRAEHDLPPLSDGPLPPLTFIGHSQANGPMAVASARLDEAMQAGWIVHDGDAELRQHVLNAVRRELSAGQWRYDRPLHAKGEKRKLYPIDLLSGLLGAHNYAVRAMGADAADGEPPVDLLDYSVVMV